MELLANGCSSPLYHPVEERTMTILLQQEKAATLLTTALLLALTPVLKVSATPFVLAQAAEVKGSQVLCDNPKASVSVPKIKVTAPNPSRLVPNVGRILREGVGVPAPDSNAPDVGAKAVAKAPDATCANDPQATGEPVSQTVQGLW